MTILAFAASLRRESFNKKLLHLAVEIARDAGATVDLADFHEFDMPLFNGDVEAKQGLPPGAQELVRRITAADGIMIAAPEYNYSISGALKNAIDWASRAKPTPFRGRHGLVMSASTSVVGGIRGLWQLRIPLEGNGLMLYPDMYALASAQKAFDEQGRLTDPPHVTRLETTVRGYVNMAQKLSAGPQP
ncbi:MAG: NAD(P)H-dependent oxidoreductase [Chlorobi bacterium]|nr:NAD(P)H-dependent oxidoreductase [Chlorobiota bacterium]MBX7217710.1 NAD(P)H-dependent oxidoreductase [Candidatus Kapabacteria bacterium]